MPYERFLAEMPWLRSGLSVYMEPSLAYDRLVRVLDDNGFDIATRDDKLMRLCAHRDPRSRKCHCLQVIWVQRYGSSTYIRYGVQPRYLLFQLCRHGDHLTKLEALASLIRTALDTA